MKRLKVLAAASAGGHWVQLRRMSPAFDGAEVHYVSTDSSLKGGVGTAKFHFVRDANLREPLALASCSAQVFFVLCKVRPDVVISTGAAPGFMAVVMGKIMGSRTIWVDSIANSEELSLAGKMVRRWADHWLTQWPELAVVGGPDFIGSVL